MKKLFIFISVTFLISIFLGCSLGLSENASEDGAAGSRSIGSLGQGLVLEYLFDSNAEDTSGEGNHGIIKGPYKSDFVEGLDGEAIEIDNHERWQYENAFVYTTNEGSLQSLSDSNFTVAYWFSYDFKADGEESSQDSMGFEIVDASNGHFLDYELPSTGMPIVEIRNEATRSNSNFEVAIYSWGEGSQGAHISVNKFLEEYKWHFVVLTADFDDTEGLKFYIDGEQCSKVDDLTKTGHTFPGLVDFHIGANQMYHQDLLVNYDNFRIYNRALSADEVDELYSYETDGSFVLFESDFYNISGSSSGGYYYEDKTDEGNYLLASHRPDDYKSKYVRFGEDEGLYLHGEYEDCIDIAKEDFDIRIKLCSTMEGIGTIMEKQSDKSGYQISLDSGIPVLALSSKGNEERFIPAGSIPLLNDGKWHELFYKVRRGSSDGVTLYIDGEPIASFDGSDFYRKSLSSDSLFLLGTNTDQDAPYVGDISNLSIIVY